MYNVACIEARDNSAVNLIYIFIENYKLLNKKNIKLSSHYKVTKNKQCFFIENSGLETDFYGENLDIVSFFGPNGSGKSTALELVKKVISNKNIEDISFMAIYEMKSRIYYMNMLEEECKVLYNNNKVIEIYPDDIEQEHRNLINYSHHIEPSIKKSDIKSKGKFRFIDCSNQASLSKLHLKSFKNNEIFNTFNLLENYSIGNRNLNSVPMIAILQPYEELSKSISSITKKINSTFNNLTESEITKDTLVEYLDDIYFQDSAKYLLDKIINKNGFNRSILTEGFPDFFSEDSIGFAIEASRLIRLNKRKVSVQIIERNKTPKLQVIMQYKIIESYFSQINNIRQLNDSECKSFFNLVLYFFDGISGKIESFDYHDTLSSMNTITTGSRFLNQVLDISADDYEIKQLSYFIDSDLNEDFEFRVYNYREFIEASRLFEKYKHLLSSFEIRWNGISSGQYSLLTLLSRIYKNIEPNVEYIIFIDEGEINFHPEWQRQYITDLVNFFSSIDSKFKLILTSHSPIVLSDLPIQSVNHMSTNNTSPPNLFGSNVFDIFTKGFLLERTIGEFSFKKISGKIKKIKSGKANIEEIEKTYNLVSDKFLKKIISDLARKKS
ncbi:AAA family ATPase [Enterovibrio norvegicus]|uniref:ATPase AAA-type core domain-containing protein n=3 Tax=Enterovibrio norvegicus TaxID=188144 RepID=A0A2N7LDD7_9GAMM|nr:ATP-binding protein [Enterovibrio norvegicus]PML81501.1 hypothetical protein BCT69_07395 [Enterovibrio norvegicus]PMN93404.1 hypothetical protein BCT23_13420 [Enterovibrio norvegicus]